jgi:transcriptional regulator with XRE-family HTH domain
MARQRKSKPRNRELAALGRAIEERMREKGMLRQDALEEASGINVRRVGDYIRGQRNPSLPNLMKLCKGLDLSLDEFLKRTKRAEDELASEPVTKGRQ